MTRRNLSPRAPMTCSGHPDSTTHLKRCAETGALHLLASCYASDTDPAPSSSACSSQVTSCYAPTTPHSVLKVSASIPSPRPTSTGGISTPTEAHCRAEIFSSRHSPPSEDRVNMPYPKAGPSATFYPSNQSPSNSWLSQKVIMCGQAIGVLVDNVKEGWESLVAFANERDTSKKHVHRKKGFKRKRKGDAT